jgi:hypothetical protein
MNDFGLAVIAFSIVFLIIGAISTHLRRDSAVDDPLVAEVVGWLSGTLMLAWMGILEGVQYALPDEVLYSAVGVFLLGVVLNGITLYVAIKVWEYCNPTWLTGTAYPEDEPADTPAAE